MLSLPEGLLAAVLLARLLWSRTLRDAAAGLVLRLSGTARRGDLVIADGVEGRVESIGSRAIVLRPADGSLVSIPASAAIGRAFFNLSRGEARARVTASIRVPLAADARRVRELLLATARRVPGIAGEPAPAVAVGVVETGAVELIISAGAPASDAQAVETELRLAALDALAASGIPQVHAQHDVHLRDLDFVKAAVARAIERRDQEKAGVAPDA